MAEGRDPFEIRPYEPDETTDETDIELERRLKSLRSGVNTFDNHELNTSDVHETSFGGTGQSYRLVENYVEDLYKILIKGGYKLENPETGPETFLFESKDGEIFVRDTKKQLTTNGGLKPLTSLEKLLSKKNLRDMGFIAPDLRIKQEVTNKLKKIYRVLPSPSDIDKADITETKDLSGKINTSTGELLHMSRDIQTDDVFEGLTLREIISQAKESATTFGHIKTLATKMATINDDIKEQQDKLDYIQNSTEYTEEEKQPLMQRIKDRISDYKEYEVDIKKILIILNIH